MSSKSLVPYPKNMQENHFTDRQMFLCPVRIGKIFIASTFVILFCQPSGWRITECQQAKSEAGRSAETIDYQ